MSGRVADIFRCPADFRHASFHVSQLRPSGLLRIWCVQLRCRRLLACARCKLWWMTPSWGTKAGDLPPETQFVLAELAEGGPYAVLLPLIDQDTYRATLRPSTRCSLAGALSP